MLILRNIKSKRKFFYCTEFSYIHDDDASHDAQ